MTYKILDHPLQKVEDTEKLENEINELAKDGYRVKSSNVYNMPIGDEAHPYALVIMVKP